MRYYTIVNFIAIFVLSLGIYYAFMWIVNGLTFSKTYASITLIHESPLYFLTIFLCVGLTFVVDLFLKGIEFNMTTSPSDFLRKVVSRKEDIQLKEDEFNHIYGKIRTQIVKEDMAREQELERRRELLAQYLER
jgi:hypothetical protein